jgi:hypothetical protein
LHSTGHLGHAHSSRLLPAQIVAWALLMVLSAVALLQQVRSRALCSCSLRDILARADACRNAQPWAQ